MQSHNLLKSGESGKLDLISFESDSNINDKKYSTTSHAENISDTLLPILTRSTFRLHEKHWELLVFY